ncbi:MAG: hypothetical protein KGJ41_17445 [Rhodospirillales bacterium]|nr:hypothetical protein [Rhodospirillales bacterium]
MNSPLVQSKMDGGAAIKGAVEHVSQGRISGWLAVRNGPHPSGWVSVAVGGATIRDECADRFRADLRRAGVCDGHAGFDFAFTSGELPNGSTVSVYASRGYGRRDFLIFQRVIGPLVGGGRAQDVGMTGVKSRVVIGTENIEPPTHEYALAGNRVRHIDAAISASSGPVALVDATPKRHQSAPPHTVARQFLDYITDLVLTGVASADTAPGALPDYAEVPRQPALVRIAGSGLHTVEIREMKDTVSDELLGLTLLEMFDGEDWQGTRIPMIWPSSAPVRPRRIRGESPCQTMLAQIEAGISAWSATGPCTVMVSGIPGHRAVRLLSSGHTSHLRISIEASWICDRHASIKIKIDRLARVFGKDPGNNSLCVGTRTIMVFREWSYESAASTLRNFSAA